jgi:hypothetical protein
MSTKYFLEQADYKIIKQNMKEAENARKSSFRQSHEEFAQRSKDIQSKMSPFLDKLNIPEDAKKQWQAQENKTIERMLKWEPPNNIKNIPWHNSTRTPPYDFPFEEKVCVLATGCEFIGTDRTIGRIGGRTVCDAVGAASTGSAITSVGTTFVAPSSGTLAVSVTARVWGEGHIGVFFSGYAEAVAGLRVYIERIYPTFQVFEGPLSNWYDHGNCGAQFNTIPLSARSRGAGHSAPADAGAVYHIWADCVQHSTQAFLSAAGVSYEVRIDSICFAVV